MPANSESIAAPDKVTPVYHAAIRSACFDTDSSYLIPDLARVLPLLDARRIRSWLFNIATYREAGRRGSFPYRFLWVMGRAYALYVNEHPYLQETAWDALGIVAILLINLPINKIGRNFKALITFRELFLNVSIRGYPSSRLEREERPKDSVFGGLQDATQVRNLLVGLALSPTHDEYVRSGSYGDPCGSCV
jgi:hypothetical protein